HGLDDLRPCRRLGVGRDRILEVEDHAIGRRRLRLLQRARVGTRHVQHAAAWADWHGRTPEVSETPYEGAIDVPTRAPRGAEGGNAVRSSHCQLPARWYWEGPARLP